uniref:Cysteine protease n=1 Tax=Albugo laibachii Nc14 TaxID=890382 RepID=F0WD68_9STRA|nr:cysteine protease family C54 putative [Albugo laibachii Nc14]|eukprot:CCA19140.1 cysteine protease family C54 putative [Albugo laibachii Nc14]
MNRVTKVHQLVISNANNKLILFFIDTVLSIRILPFLVRQSIQLIATMSQFAHGISSVSWSSLSDPNTSQNSSKLWLLGDCYSPQDFDNFDSMKDAYHDAFESILWYTYRRDFETMVPYDFTSDAGWGCMLRSAQMLLSEAFKRNMLGIKWKIPARSEDLELPKVYVKLLKWFVDSFDTECKYSIHNITRIGMQYDKLPGEWYGPTTAAQALRDLVNLHAQESPECNLVMYVPQDGVVYTKDVNELCISHLDQENTFVNVNEETQSDGTFPDPLLHPPTDRDNSEKMWQKSLLILIPLRLGLDSINPRYLPAIQRVFEFPQNVGIIGGKKGHSVYFVGTFDSKLQLLDPHDIHPTADLNTAFPTATHLRTVHSRLPLEMSLGSIDPSLALGFYCSDRKDYLDFVDRVDRVQSELGGALPFSIAKARPNYDLTNILHTMSDCCLSDDCGTEEVQEDEYVLL